MRTGKVISVPPPAMELMTPAAKAAATIRSMFGRDIIGFEFRVPGFEFRTSFFSNLLFHI